MLSKVWLSKPHLSESENIYINEALSSNWVTTKGNNIDEFENELSRYLKTNNLVVALNSGTSAIHLGLLSLGVGYGDDVICQTFTFCASANPILYLKANPIFVESEKDTWNMSPFYLEKAIVDRLKKNKKPKAIVVVNSYGMPAKWDKLITIAKNYQIPILEDSAAAIGSKYKNKHCGLFGNFGVFSFNGNKIITTSSGGVLLLNENQDKNKLILKATQSNIGEFEYIHNEVGYNYRMSNVLAGIGRGQLKVLEDRIYRRRKVNDLYVKNVDNNRFNFFKEPSNDYFSNHWLSCLTLNYKKDNINNLIILLKKKNIEVRKLWRPLHLQRVFKNAPYYGDNYSKSLFEIGLCLPSSSNLSFEEQQRVINVLNEN